MIQTRRQAQDRKKQQNMRNAMKQGVRNRQAKADRARKSLRKKTWGF